MTPGKLRYRYLYLTCTCDTCMNKVRHVEVTLRVVSQITSMLSNIIVIMMKANV